MPRLNIAITGSLKDFRRALRTAEGDMRKFSRRAGNLGARVAKGVGIGTAAAAAGLAAVGAQGLKTFANLDKGVREVATLIPGATAETVEGLRTQISEVSKEFGIPGEEAAKAFYDGLSAGVSQADIQPFSEAAAKFATAGATSIGSATDLLTSAVNAYGLDASQAGEVSDIFFATVRAGKTTVDELSSAFFQFGPVAAAAGIPLEEVNGWLAQLTLQGVPTRQAATQMKGALAELGKEGTVASKAFEEASGTTFPAFIEQGGTLADAFDLLAQHAEATGTSVLNLFGQVEAGQGVLAVAGNIDALRETTENLGDSAGATADAFDIMAGGAAFAFDKLKANFEQFQAEIGKVALPIAEQLLPIIQQLITDILPHFQVLIGAVGEALNGLLPALTPLIGQLVGALAPVLQRLGPLFGRIGNLVAAILTPVIRILTPILNILASAIDSVLVGLDALMPIIVAVADFLALVLIPPLKVVEAIMSGLSSILGWVGISFGNTTKQVTDYTTALKGIPSEVTTTAQFEAGEGHPTADGYTVPVSYDLEPMDFTPWWQEFLNTFSASNIKQAWDNMMAEARELWDGLWEYVFGESDGLRNHVIAAFDWFKGHLDSILEDARALWDGAWDYIFGDGEGSFRSHIVGAFNWFKGHLDTVLGDARTLWDGLWEYVFDNEEGGASLRGHAIAAFDWFKGHLDTVLGEAQDLWSSLWSSVFAEGGSFRNLVRPALLWLGEQFNNVFQTFGRLGQSAMDAIVKGANKFLDLFDVAAGPFINFGEIPRIKLPTTEEFSVDELPASNYYGKGALGGIVTRPTHALIGEAGPEAVIPLDRMPGASALPGGLGQPIVINVNMDNGFVGDENQLAEAFYNTLAKVTRTIGTIDLANLARQ